MTWSDTVEWLSNSASFEQYHHKRCHDNSTRCDNRHKTVQHKQVVPRDLLKDTGAREVLSQKTCPSMMKPEDGVPYQPVETEN